MEIANTNLICYNSEKFKKSSNYVIKIEINVKISWKIFILSIQGEEKIKKIILTIAILSLGLTGCETINTKKINSNQQENFNEFDQINTALKNATYAKSNLELISPTSGEHQLPINKFTDKQNRTFAVAFHKSNFQQNKLRMSILQKKQKNEWFQLLNIPHQGYDVDKLMFIQNKNNNTILIVVGYHGNYFENMIPSLNTKHSKFFNIYEFNPDNLQFVQKPISNNQFNKHYVKPTPYDVMDLIDLGDSYGKILISFSINYESEFNQERGNFNVFHLNTSNKIYQNNKLEIKNNFLEKFEKFNDSIIKLDKKSFDQPAIFLNLKNYYSSNTFVFLIEKTENSLTLKQIYEKSEKALNNSIFDFDNDGCVEIPVAEPFPGYKILGNILAPAEKNSEELYIHGFFNHEMQNSLNIVKPPQITNWTKLSLENNKIQQKFVPTYTNFAQGYGFLLPNTWNKKVSARYLNKNKTIEFFEFEGSINNNEKKILTITSCQAVTKLPTGFFIIKKSGPFYFAAKIHSSTFSGNKNLLISEDQLKQSFFLLKNQPTQV